MVGSIFLFRTHGHTLQPLIARRIRKKTIFVTIFTMPIVILRVSCVIYVKMGLQVAVPLRMTMKSPIKHLYSVPQIPSIGIIPIMVSIQLWIFEQYWYRYESQPGIGIGRRSSISMAPIPGILWVNIPNIGIRDVYTSSWSIFFPNRARPRSIFFHISYFSRVLRTF